MLGRIAAASRFAATPLRSLAPRAGAAFRPTAGFAGAARGAAAVSSPKPLSIRMDSLFVKCMVAAVIYFVPQDAVFLTGLFWMWHTESAAVSPKTKQADPEASLAAFKAKKGLDDVKVYKGRGAWYVSP